MVIRCTSCGRVNSVPDNAPISSLRCRACGAYLRRRRPTSGETSAAVGLVGGALLGAAIGGPVGAVIGGILGGLIGKDAKGLG